MQKANGTTVQTTGGSKGLKLVDILVTIVIAVVFGIIYKIWAPVYDLAHTAGFQLEQIANGMWLIAGPVAFLIIRKPGVALLAEVAASVVEMAIGSEWGASTLIYGIVQGLFAEIIFALFRYRNYSWSVAALAGAASAVASVLMDYYYNYVGQMSAWNLTLFYVSRLLGGILVAGLLANVIVKALEATGVTNLVRPASKKDYEDLNK